MEVACKVCEEARGGKAKATIIRLGKKLIERETLLVIVGALIAFNNQARDVWSILAFSLPSAALIIGRQYNKTKALEMDAQREAMKAMAGKFEGLG